ncbi:hypothetical protein HYDPIDRAFT_115371, partial [Hydnomerulius pinastri MD-312]
MFSGGKCIAHGDSCSCLLARYGGGNHLDRPKVLHDAVQLFFLVVCLSSKVVD